MTSCSIALFTIALLVSGNASAALISTLTSFDNTGSLIAGDQSDTTINDWATATVFHVENDDLVVDSLTAVFGSTNSSTSSYLEVGVYESVGEHGFDLAPGVLIGAFDPSSIYTSTVKISVTMAAYSSFELKSNTDYLLVWNAQPAAPYLGTKRGGTLDQMFNTGDAGFFTGEIMSSQDGGRNWFSANQFGFDQASFNGLILSDEAASVVPVPPALWLFGGGLLGLIGIARRKKSS